MLVTTATGFFLVQAKKTHAMSRNGSDNFGFIFLSAFQIQLPCEMAWRQCAVFMSRRHEYPVARFEHGLEQTQQN
jgi:hypothetical protein